MNLRAIGLLVAPLLAAALMPSLPARAIQPVSQPAGEAAAQKWLPKVHDTLWTKLMKCEVELRRQERRLQHPRHARGQGARWTDGHGARLRPADGRLGPHQAFPRQPQHAGLHVLSAGSAQRGRRGAVAARHRMDRQDRHGDGQAQADQRRGEGALLQDRECAR